MLYTIEVDVQFVPVYRGMFELGGGIVMEDPTAGFAVRIRPVPEEEEEDER